MGQHVLQEEHFHTLSPTRERAGVGVQTGHILYILNRGHGLHSSPARQGGHAEAGAADAQPSGPLPPTCRLA